MTAFEHNVDSKLFQVFKPPAHLGISDCRLRIGKTCAPRLSARVMIVRNSGLGQHASLPQRPDLDVQRDGADCRTTAAKESAKRTCFFGSRDDPLEEMKSVSRETADEDNQQTRRAVFRNLLKRKPQ